MTALAPTAINHDLLMRPAHALVLITFSWALLGCLRNKEPLEEPFVRLTMAILLMYSFDSIMNGAMALSTGLVKHLERLGDKTALIDFISDSLQRASNLHSSPSQASLSQRAMTSMGNAAEVVTQVFRTGVWGICASVVELLFLVVRYVLSVGRDVLWHLVLVFMPLMIATLPATTRFFTTMALVSLELCLWQPVLTVVDIVTSKVARARSLQTGDIGLTVIAVELLAIVLGLGVIPLCHKLVSGSIGLVDLGAGVRGTVMQGRRGLS